MVNEEMMLYPGYDPQPGIDPRLFHYGLPVQVLDWEWAKSKWRSDLVDTCGRHVPDPPDVSKLSTQLDPVVRI